MVTVADLQGISKEKYGEGYSDHLIEIYTLYVKMADNVSERRQSANAFFLGINSVIVAGIGSASTLLDATVPTVFYCLISLLGIILAFQWHRLVLSYKQLNTGKFKIIHLIEELLPIKPYDAEWVALGSGEDPRIYKPFTDIETRVPWIFFVLHILLLLSNLPIKQIINL